MNRKNNGKKSIFKIIADIFTWTIFAILMLVAAFLIYYVIANNIYARKGERFKPIVSLYTIISGSMLPTIKVYDVVVNLRIDDPSQLHEGDVITFISQSKINYGDTITHRINKITYDNGTYYFTTKGDNNLVPDESPVEFSNIIGKVILKIPQLGQAQFFLLKQGPKLFIILIPSFGILIYDLLKMLNLFDTKKKVDKSLEIKENKLSKKEQEELKDKIRKRLSENDTSDNLIETKEEVAAIDKAPEIDAKEELKEKEIVETKEQEEKAVIEVEKENSKDDDNKETTKLAAEEPEIVKVKENLETKEQEDIEVKEKDIKPRSETSSKPNNSSKNKQNASKPKQVNRNNNNYNKNRKTNNNRNNTNNKYKKNNNTAKKNNNQPKKEKDNTNLDIDVDKVLKKIKDKNY